MERPVFGGMLVKAVESEDLRKTICQSLTAMVRSELLKLRLDGVLPCPYCGFARMVLRGKADGKQRLLCRGCGRTLSIRAGTPFHKKQYQEGLIILALILLLDSNMSMLTISGLLRCDYKALSRAVKEARTAFVKGFPKVWLKIREYIESIIQVDDTYTSCSGFKGGEPPRDGLERGLRVTGVGVGGRGNPATRPP